jgi:hypothetical protein
MNLSGTGFVIIVHSEHSTIFLAVMNMEKQQKTFNELTNREKALLLEDAGILVCSIEFYDYRIYLYAYNNMLVEVFQNIETKAIEQMTTADYGNLDKYASRITMSSLFSNGKKIVGL